MRSLPALLLAVLVVTACTDEPTPSANTYTPPTPSLQPADERQVIEVDSAEALVNAIGSDRILRLAPGHYNLSDLTSRYLPSVAWNSVHDGQSLTIRKIENLRIEGPAGKTRITVVPRYANVLMFETCSNIELSGLTLGHHPDKGCCAGGVLVLNDCSDITIEAAHLFGCGTFGLEAYDCNEVRMRKTLIDGCTSGGMVLRDSRGLYFNDCRLESNEYWGRLISIDHCENVAFVNCRIHENVPYGDSGVLLHAESSAKVVFADGVIAGNPNAQAARSNTVDFLNTRIERSDSDATTATD